MKLYFTKYFPEEGEIKEGDWYISDRDDVFQDKPGTRHYKGDRKLKLFMCSRNIQIGDEFYNPFCIKVDHLFDEEDIQDNLKDHFKIIGPVSEAALPFVKEGQEFDREDIRIFKTADSYSSKIITEMLGKKWEHEEDHIITPGKVFHVKVKGSDGKFY